MTKLNKKVEPTIINYYISSETLTLSAYTSIVVDRLAIIKYQLMHVSGSLYDYTSVGTYQIINIRHVVDGLRFVTCKQTQTAHES